jgi:hypothetical protein
LMQINKFSDSLSGIYCVSLPDRCQVFGRLYESELIRYQVLLAGGAQKYVISLSASQPALRRPPRGGRCEPKPLTRFMVPPRRAVPPFAPVQWRPPVGRGGRRAMLVASPEAGCGGGASFRSRGDVFQPVWCQPVRGRRALLVASPEAGCGGGAPPRRC